MTDTRDRMVEAAVDALQHRGVAGMSFTEILAASGAARGAIYHHFPGGKTELVAEAATRNGQDVCGFLAALPAGTPLEVTEAFLAAIRPVLTASASTGSGCAVAALTIGTDRQDALLRQVAQRTFDSWTHTLTDRLTAAGLPSAAAADLATTLITLLEGAHVLCRAAGSTEPLERAERTARFLAEHYPGG